MAKHDTDQAWQQWGAKDPYYGVVTYDNFRKENLTEENRRAFFESGENHVAKVLANVRRLVSGTFETKRALDFGCGVGRLVLPLANKFDEVVGVDISEAMLTEARRNCGAREITNVSFARSDDELSAVNGTFDLVHSYIVFQHIPVERGERIAAKLLDKLRPGGIAALHFTYHRRAPRLKKAITWARANIPYAHDVANRLQGRPAGPLMQMNDYNLNRLFALFDDAGITRTYAEPTDHGGFLGLHFYLEKGHRNGA